MGLMCYFGKHKWRGFKCASCGKTEHHKLVLTTLRVGAATGDIKAIEKALTAIDVNARGLDGATALIIAASTGQLDAIRMLLAIGANADAVDDQGQSALTHAVNFGRTDIVETLLAAGAKLDAPDHQGMTALFHAAFHANAPLVELLLKSGADVNAKDLTGMTALMCAASKGDVGVINMLLAAGADAMARNFEGTNAYMIASHFRQNEAAALLKPLQHK